MKKVMLMLVAVCALSMSTAVYAQEQCPDAKRMDRKELKERHVMKMKKELNLSDEQMAQMKAANEEFDAAVKANRENMKSAKEKHDAAIDKVLTPDQKVKFDEMKKKHHGKKEFRAKARPISRDGKCKEMKCDGKHKMDCKKDCTQMKDCKKNCDKKNDCPKMKGECKDCNTCDKAEKCDKAQKCDKSQKCDKAQACHKTDKCDKAEKCDKTQKCDKKNECTKK